MAYQSELMTAGESEKFAETFLNLFAGDAKYFTNLLQGRVGGPGDAGWRFQAITTAIFDTGVVALDDHQIGIIWVEDTD
jgi:hypothetical protein